MEKTFTTYDDLPLVMSVRDVATVLGISLSGAHALFNQPDFPSTHVGSRKLIKRDNFLKWLDEAR